MGGYQTLAGGTPTNAVVNVQIGKTPGDPLPLTVGCSVVVENKFDTLRLQWAVQAGVIAVLVVSDDADGNGVQMVAPPSVTLGSLSIVDGGNTANVDANGSLQAGVFLYVAGKNWGGIPDKVSGTNGTASGAVRVMGGPVGTNAAAVLNPALNSLPQSSAAAGPQVQPGQLGGSSSQTSSAASGATTIVAAGSNANGLVIRIAQISNSGQQCAMTAGTSAPSSTTSNQVILSGQGGAINALLPREIFLPAGQGLYFYSAAAGGIYDVSYDIL